MSMSNEFYKMVVVYPHVATFDKSRKNVSKLFLQVDGKIEMTRQVKIDGTQGVVFSSSWQRKFIAEKDVDVNNGEETMQVVYGSRNVLLDRNCRQNTNNGFITFCEKLLEKQFYSFFNKYPDLILYGEYDYMNARLENRKFYIFDVGQFIFTNKLTTTTEITDTPAVSNDDDTADASYDVRVQLLDFRKFIPEFDELGLDYIPAETVFQGNDGDNGIFPKILNELENGAFDNYFSESSLLSSMKVVDTASSKTTVDTTNPPPIEGWVYKFFPFNDTTTTTIDEKDHVRDKKYVFATCKRINPHHPQAVKAEQSRLHAIGRKFVDDNPNVFWKCCVKLMQDAKNADSVKLQKPVPPVETTVSVAAAEATEINDDIVYDQTILRYSRENIDKLVPYFQKEWLEDLQDGDSSNSVLQNSVTTETLKPLNTIREDVIVGLFRKWLNSKIRNVRDK